MWFIKSWIYKSRYGKLPFKMRNFTASFQQECRESINKSFNQITSKLDHIWTRILLKKKKQLMHESFVDILGDSNPMKHPIFSENEGAKFTQNKNLYKGVLLLMIIFETALYSLMANLFLNRQTLKQYAGIEYIFGLGFALIFVMVLHFGFKNLWEFLEAKNIIEVKELDKKRLNPFYTKLFIGIALISFFVVTNISTGFIRATILEPSSTSSSSFLDKIHGPLLFFSIAITFIVALVMALLEKDISEKSEKYKVYKNWKRQNKELKIYNTQVKNMLKDCLEVRASQVEKYWGVLKDLQRVFRIEVDEDKQPLYNELNDKISKNEIDLKNLNDEIYQRYMEIAITRYELFAYGVNIDKDIIKTISNLQDKVIIIEDSEKVKSSKNNTEIEIPQNDIKETDKEI
jgi:ribosomal protein S20